MCPDGSGKERDTGWIAQLTTFKETKPRSKSLCCWALIPEQEMHLLEAKK